MNESYRDFVTLLYFKDLSHLYSTKINDPENIAIYRVGRVLFGLSSSLFSGTLIHHAHNYASFDPDFFFSFFSFFKSLHVDDLISSPDSLQEVENFYLTFKERLTTANFNVRKFVSNFRQLQLLHKQCYK